MSTQKISRQWLFVFLFVIVYLAAHVLLSSYYNKNKSINQERGVYQIYLSINSKEIRADLVDTEELRTKGLSGRESLKGNEGMFFDFLAEGDHRIWMKDMNFPIDILWIDKDLKIIHIEKNVSPDTFPEIFSSPTVSRYVLELPAGFSDQNRIGVGNKVLFEK